MVFSTSFNASSSNATGIENPKLLDEYIAVETRINHSFRSGFWLKEVKEAINQGYIPKQINDWVM